GVKGGVGGEKVEDAGFVNSSKKKGFIHFDIPVTQCCNYAFVRRRVSRGDDGRAYARLLGLGVLCFEPLALYGGDLIKEYFQAARIVRISGARFFSLVKPNEFLFLIYPFSFIVREHAIEVERHA